MLLSEKIDNALIQLEQMREEQKLILDKCLRLEREKEVQAIGTLEYKEGYDLVRYNPTQDDSRDTYLYIHKKYNNPEEWERLQNPKESPWYKRLWNRLTNRNTQTS